MFGKWTGWLLSIWAEMSEGKYCSPMSSQTRGAVMMVSSNFQYEFMPDSLTIVHHK